MKAILTMLLTVFTISNTNQNGEFRGYPWKTQKSEVLELETEPLLKNEKDKLMYRTKYRGDDFMLIYKFFQNKLINRRYLFTDSHLDKTEYVEKYAKYENILEHKYGDPCTSNWGKNNNLNKDNSVDERRAINLGLLEYHSVWYLRATTVSLKMECDDRSNGLCIMYSYNGIMSSADGTLKRRE